MKELLSKAYAKTGESFISTILAAAADPNVISFAGGLPNPASFPKVCRHSVSIWQRTTTKPTA